MMNSVMEALEDHKFEIVISVGEGISLGLNVEKGESPSLLDIQEVLLLMCLQIRSQLNEK